MRDIQTTVLGNATADPSERTHADGTVTATVRIAVTGRYFDPGKGDFSDRKTKFISVFLRRTLAQNVLRSVTKGQPLVVTGRLGSSEWTGEDGTVRHSLTLQAEAIGHDLTFGTATFARPTRQDEVPDLDPVTGELSARAPRPDVVDELTDGSAAGEELVGAS